MNAKTAVVIGAALAWAAVTGLMAQEVTTVSKSADLMWSEDSASYYFIPPGMWPDLYAWGNGTAGGFPYWASNAVQAVAGPEHSMCLQSNGVIDAWGDDRWGQCDVPTNLTGTNAVSLSLSTFQSAAVLGDGTVAVWGDFQGAPEDLALSQSVRQAQFLDGETLLVLLADGTVELYTNGVEVPLGISGAVQIASWSTNLAAPAPKCCAVLSDGSVVNWGSGATHTYSGATGVVSIAEGSTLCAAVRSDGKVVDWNPTLTTGAVVSGNFVQVSAAGPDVWALAATNTPIRIAGSIVLPSGPPKLYSISAGGGGVISITDP